MIDSQILMIYNHPYAENAPTIMENVKAFKKYSKYHVQNINLFEGFPSRLNKLRFNVIILHYSSFLFIKDKFYEYLKSQNDSTIIAFFQDEYIYCKERFKLINDLNIKVVYTLLEKKDHFVYKENTSVKTVHHHFTGYVDEDLMSIASSFKNKNDERKIDIGYRARPLPFYNGRGAQEKTDIGKKFLLYASKMNLNLDIKSGEGDRIYANRWYEFITSCKAMLGVEAGVSIFDLDGSAEKLSNEYRLNHPKANFEEVHSKVLQPYENKVYYRMISPRIFESAALNTCMIMFEGKYNHIMKPDVHYISLKKDFSNLDAVIATFKNLPERLKIIENAYNDLIYSKKYTYERFIDEFDEFLEKMNFIDSIFDEKIELVSQLINKDKMIRKARLRLKLLLIKIYLNIPFRNFIKASLKSLFKKNKIN